MIQFVLLSIARSGSDYLSSLLSSHPNVICQGEILNQTSSAAWERIPADTTALGFKVNNRERDQNPYLIPLLNCWGTRYVVLERRNQLEGLRSFVQANLTGVWNSEKPDGAPLIHLSPQECQKRFDLAARYYDSLREQLPPQQTAWTYYEDLLLDPDRALTAVWNILGVEPHPVSSPHRKLESRSLANSVCNHAEVVAAFTNTEYERFL